MDDHLGKRYDTCNICLQLLFKHVQSCRYEEDGQRICDAFVIGVAGAHCLLDGYLSKALKHNPSLQAALRVARSNALPIVGTT